MLVQIEAYYEAGGYPSPTYRGSKTFAINTANEIDLDALMDEAQRKARSIVARDMCFEPRCVSITQVRILGKQ